MPTVRITNKIKREIIKNAEIIATDQRDNLPEAEPELGKKIINFLIDNYNLPTKGHKDVINEVTRIHFSDLSYMTDNDNELYEFNVYVNPPIKVMLPHILATSPDTIWIGSLIKPDFPDDILQDLNIIVNKRVSIEQQCNNFIKTIQDLLIRCTTLKQFIEAWPQGEQFVGQIALQQHYEQEKKQRKRGIYLDDETLSDLNSILLTSKII